MMSKDEEPSDWTGAQQPPSPRDVYCVVGETLCRITIYTEAEWRAIPPARRPKTAAFYPGVGWIAAVPSAGPI